MPAGAADRTLPALLERCVRWKGNETLLEDEAERLSAGAAADAVARVAVGLAGAGVGKGDRVAFLAGSSVRHALTFFACARLGAVPCALHARERAERLAEALEWLGARVLVTDPDRQALAREARERASPPVVGITLGDAPAEGCALGFRELAGQEPLLTPARVDPDDLAYLILSSGTTGSPKGVVHRQRTAWAAALAAGAVYGEIGRADRLLLPMGPSFAAWVNLVLPFLASRSTLVFRGRFEPEAYLETLERDAITYAALPPTLWRLVLRAAAGRPRDLSRVRYVFFSGEPGSRDLVEALTALFPAASVRGAYLSSEGGCGAGVVADQRLLVEGGKPTAAGLPVPGAELRIVPFGGPPDEPLPDGEAGEIALAAPSLASGYWRDEALGRERFRAGWWLTGDVGFRDADGHVFVTGRTDNVINTGGVKVHAEEVEAALLGHPDVELVAVVGVPDETWGSAIEAHVVARRAGLTEAELLRHCRSLPALSDFKVPKRVVFHEALPLTATGKIFRRGLRGEARPPEA